MAMMAFLDYLAGGDDLPQARVVAALLGVLAVIPLVNLLLLWFVALPIGRRRAGAAQNVGRSVSSRLDEWFVVYAAA